MRPSWSNGSPTSRIGAQNESGSAVRGQPLPGRQQTGRSLVARRRLGRAEPGRGCRRLTSRPDIRSREMCTSVCCIGLIGRPRESCCWRRRARRPVDCPTSFDRGRSQKSTGPSWKDGPRARKGNGSTGSARTAEPTEPAWLPRKAVRGRRLGSSSAWWSVGRVLPSSSYGPSTGRSHQLRVQLAARGLPILGDGKYGATSRLIALDGHLRIALHARTLTFSHPTRREAILVEAPVQADWPESSPEWWERWSGSNRPAAGSNP